MKQEAEKLIFELIEQTRKHVNYAESLKKLPNQVLNWKPNIDAWNVVECLAHLNLYSDFYHPEIKNAMQNSRHISEVTYSSGWLGNYFANSMLPKEKLNKMKTFKDKNPINFPSKKTVIDDFVQQQLTLIELLNQAKKANLNKTKTAISISQLIKLRLGDTFRFLINHNIRHIHQIQKLLKAQKVEN